MAVSKDQIIEAIKEMNIVELNELVKTIEEEFGVSAVAPVAAAAGPAAEESPSEVDVILEAAGAQKMKVIKLVGTITGLGLKDAKALVDGTPSKIKEKVSPEAAEEVKAQLEELGATVKVA